MFQFIPIDCFEGQSLDGRMVAVIPGGRSIPLNFHNRHEYVESVINFKLREMESQVATVLFLNSYNIHYSYGNIQWSHFRFTNKSKPNVLCVHLLFLVLIDNTGACPSICR